MQHFSQAHCVLYVNPFSSDLLGSMGPSRRKGLWVRICRKMNSLTRGLSQLYDNLYVFSPVFLPIQGSPLVDRMNNALLRLQLKRIGGKLHLNRPLVWLENVRAVDILSSLHTEGIVYHVSDLFASDKYTANKGAQRRREARATEESDLLICVSRRLYDLKRTQAKNVHYLPHGVDFELFRAAAEKRKPVDELSGIARPIAGYFGTMTANNDIEMMVYCARTLRHVSFVFAGQITGGDYAELGALDNVYLLGRVPYERIPHICAHFDVCLLQWKMSDWIRNCNPLKMLEYMASGKPIVSVEIDEARQYSDVISIARNKEEFCRAIQWELGNDTESRRARRVEIASQHRWAKHIERLSSLIDCTIERKRAVSL